MSIQVLDCTLRDGGYVNDWRFLKKTTTAILEKLACAGIDIIECGFLTDSPHNSECTLFSSPTEIYSLLPKLPHRAMFVAMIAMGEHALSPDKLPPCDPNGITGIRLTFHKDEIDRAVEWAARIQQKGYRVFMQPVGTVFYSDLELLSLVERMNELSPYAFYIVDTLGSMYRNDVSHRFYLIDKNLNEAIHIGFHGHNNLQLAFSNAQILGKIQTKRTLILDAYVYGMGRGAGNLPTELITQYINENIATRYDVTKVMDIYDEYIADIRKQHEWGYSMAYHIAASHVCHPNYASYLLGKQTLTVKDIDAIIRRIPASDRMLFDRALIERLYVSFQNNTIDDRDAVKTLSHLIGSRPVLLLSPRLSDTDAGGEVQTLIEQVSPFIVSVHFVTDNIKIDACFFSNHKRLDQMNADLIASTDTTLIVTSNLTPPTQPHTIVADYVQCRNEEPLAADNAGLMLLTLLSRCGVREVFCAGFDDFSVRTAPNAHTAAIQTALKKIKQHLTVHLLS